MEFFCLNLNSSKQIKMIIGWLIFLVFISITEYYAFQALKTIVERKRILTFYKIFSLVVVLILIFNMAKFDRSVGQTKQTLFTFGLLLLIYIPKLIIMIFMLFEDIFRAIYGIGEYLFGNNKQDNFLPKRRKFVSQIAMGLAAVPFLDLIYGMAKGKYNYRVIKQSLYFHDLPQDFDGFTITQISDVHSGSLDDPEKIKEAIDLINHQNSDMILFTGDIVNAHAKEMEPWIDVFNEIKPHIFGKYAVLGNHDYGEYLNWSSQEAKDENFKAIKSLYGQIDFDLLLNQHVKIKKGESEIALVGVENWGYNFKKAGDIDKASEGLTRNDFKILMSHDPSHWDEVVKKHPKNFQFTLSGHTHGFQFGIEIPGFLKWSPVQYIYKQWAGLYSEFGRYIYVNRGFGFHLYPGRVGIWPEITVFELKKGESK